jgi:hypothetical protein
MRALLARLDAPGPLSDTQLVAVIAGGLLTVGLHPLAGAVWLIGTVAHWRLAVHQAARVEAAARDLLGEPR